MNDHAALSAGLSAVDPELVAIATGRKRSLFADDMAAHGAAVAAAVAGRSILVIGGAGSIGSAVASLLADLGPARLHLVDHSENNLAELVRDLRSRPQGLAVGDFRTEPLDYGAPAMRLFLDEAGPYDAVLNFAAIKHVRSEKDMPSLLQMIDTNIVKQRRFLGWLAERGFAGRYFSVSTDKAANPVSLMGASKRLMEHVMFSGEAVPGLAASVSSARFANVAFSDGSLLQAFLKRLEKRQALAVPAQVERYFISTGEAAEICLLGAFLSPDRTILVPRTEAGGPELVPLRAVAEGVLRHFGWIPAPYQDEAEARTAVAAENAQARWPLLLTPLDTGGEKAFEEFVGSDETVAEIGFERLVSVAYAPARPGTLAPLLDALAAAVAGERRFDTAAVAALMADAMPLFRHRASTLNLDQRM